MKKSLVKPHKHGNTYTPSEMFSPHCVSTTQPYVVVTWEIGSEWLVWRTVGQDRQKCKETSSHLADKQQKMGEYVENIKFSWVSKLNFMFSTCSPLFCCLSNRGLEVSLHFWRSWPTVCHLVFSRKEMQQNKHNKSSLNWNKKWVKK